MSTTSAWRWLIGWGALPAVLGVLVFWIVPESPNWLATRGAKKAPATPIKELLQPPLRRVLIIGILLGSIPMMGAWAASKWMIPWADQIGGSVQPGYKASTQGYWALGAVLGSFFGAQLASRVGRRLSYFLISIGSAALTCGLFTLTASLRPEFLPLVQSMFREHRHESVHEFLLRMRMDQARQLLCDERLAIKEVSARLNFSNEFYFSRFFRKRTGMSPRRFRESIKV